MRFRHDPDGARLPIKIDSTSNGEFAPRPLTRGESAMVSHAHANASANARRRGLGRREFLVTACGAATTLAAMNEANAAAGVTGGSFRLHADAGLDQGAAADTLEGDEFIFDVQNHAINPNGAWRLSPSGNHIAAALGRSTTAAQNYAHSAQAGEFGYLNMLDGEHYVKDVFVDSDTSMTVMSVLSTDHAGDPLQMPDAAAIRAKASMLGRRVLLHGKALPNLRGDLDHMNELKERWDVVAWKLYTQLAPAPDTTGYRLDDEALMTPMIERARALGVKIVCAHKGLPFGAAPRQFATASDVGGAARLFPDIAFIVYHGGFEYEVPEGPYDPDNAAAGVNALVKSLLDNGVGPNANVYAELGATWRTLLRRPDEAAHAWGKLLRYVGEDNVLWGTDCIWFGSPQDQIQAFRAFDISNEYQERFGYPSLTPAIKRKIFGLNAARVYGVAADEIAAARGPRGPDPAFVTHGPKTRRGLVHH